ncbi:MAG: CotH kinase family protein [Clostridia bacterium]|nr:CotH kinase family protein [Clostridia bacterium]
MTRRLLPLIFLGALLLPMLAPLNALASDGAVSEQEVIDTGLPVLYLQLDNGETITDRETWKDGVMRIRNTDDYSACTNLYTEQGGGIRLKGRGNSTWWQFQTQKRAYSLKLDEKVSLFGMDASKNWTLLANYMDRSNLRNLFAYNLSGRLGMEYCASSFVNLYLNGNYQGGYQLCEKPSAPIDEWEDLGETLAEAIIYRNDLGGQKAEELLNAASTDLSWMTEKVWQGYTVADYIDLSDRKIYGNYLIEYDYYYDEPSKFHTAYGVPLNIRSPENLYTNPKAMKELEKHIQQFENALYSDTFINADGYHYSAYVDMDSLVEYYIVNALIKNVEFGYKSMYLHLDEDGIIHLGPCWDYDWSSGNHFLGAAPNPEAWYDDWRASTNTWYLQLYGDPYFVALVQERWFEILPVIKEEIGRLAQWEAYLAAASDLEREVYLTLEGEGDYRNQSGDYSFADEVEAFRQFLNERVAWMNKQFKKSDPNIEDAGMGAQYDLGLTLLDADGELAVPNDTDFPVDYVADGVSDLVIVADTAVTMILNGNPLAYGQQSCIITPEYLREGVNVLIARTEDGKQQVLRFETPSAEPTFISVGRDTVASPPVQTIVYMEQPAIVLPAEAPDTSLLWGGAIAASVILLLSGGVSAILILRRKKV